MQLTITGHHLEITTPLKDYVEASSSDYNATSTI